VAAAAAGAADLLPSPEQGVRHPECTGLERASVGLWLRERFEVRRSFLSSHEVHRVGGESILEYWIPAEDLPALNASIVGRIELVAEYY
jgi:hypothetical protein